MSRPGVHIRICRCEIRSGIVRRTWMSHRMVTLVHVPRERPADEPIRLAPAGAITFSVAVPLVVVVLFFVTEPHHLPEAAAATALYLPLHVRHVRYALREKRP